MVKVKRKVKAAGSSSKRRGLELEQLTVNRKEEGKKPLIYTDQQQTSEEEIQSSSASVDDQYQNNNTVGSVEEEQQMHPELKPEELFSLDPSITK